VKYVLSGPTPDQFQKVRVDFSEPMVPASFTIGDAYLNDPDGMVIFSTDIIPVGSDRRTFDVVFPTQSRRGTFKLFLGPDIYDDSGNMMDQNQDGLNGDDARVNIRVGPPLTVASAAAPKKVIIGRTTVSALVVNQDFTIGDLNAALNIAFPSDRNLIITLVAPWGQQVTLFNRRGGSGANLTGTTFDDEAPTAVGDGASPFNGSFRPEGSLTVFDGQNARGTWQLQVTGVGKQEFTGSLTGWSLTFANY
jgi:subtilisin-like proprotein convertase family protein